MLAEAAEHRVIGSSILSTAFRQTITFLSWAHCVKIHGPQETRGIVRCRESGLDSSAWTKQTCCGGKRSRVWTQICPRGLLRHASSTCTHLRF